MKDKIIEKQRELIEKFDAFVKFLKTKPNKNNIAIVGYNLQVSTLKSKLTSLEAGEEMEELMEDMDKYSEQPKDESKACKSAEEILDEREALIKAFDQIRQSFEGREWLMQGRGAYPYDDERYKEEVRYIMDEFNKINTSLWKQIKSKSFEYRNSIEAPLLKKIKELEAYASQQMPSEEEIEEHFSIEAHRVGFIPSEGYNRMQRHKIEGAKWVINQINKKQ